MEKIAGASHITKSDIMMSGTTAISSNLHKIEGSNIAVEGVGNILSVFSTRFPTDRSTRTLIIIRVALLWRTITPTSKTKA